MLTFQRRAENEGIETSERRRGDEGMRWEGRERAGAAGEERACFSDLPFCSKEEEGERKKE